MTGGGTAGHVTPNIALLPRLREYGFEIHYIGTKDGIESRLMKNENVPFNEISAGKLRRYLSLKNFTDIIRIFLGFFQSIFLLLRIRPNVVFSKGGFVSCPVVWASWITRKPIIIHESDITPGLANRLSQPFATRICYSFPETGNALPSKKATYTGLPVREVLKTGDRNEGYRLCDFEHEKPVVMIMGGSQGSLIINNAIKDALDLLLERYTICHIYGNSKVAENRPGYCGFEYVTDQLPHLFAAADIMVCRSGATTLFELLELRKPNLLIPLATNASRGDQILNARSFEKQGFSRILLQGNLNSETLLKEIDATYNHRNEMIETMNKHAPENSIGKVADLLEKCKKR